MDLAPTGEMAVYFTDVRRQKFYGTCCFFKSILNYSELVKYNNGIVDTIFMIAGDSYLDEVFFEDFNVNTIDPKE